VQSNAVCSLATAQQKKGQDLLRDPAPNGIKASFIALVGDSHRDGSKL
jgi:hypothetical protein